MDCVIDELRNGYSFIELFELSLEFFFEYERCDPAFFAIDKVSRDEIKKYFNSYIDNPKRKAFCAYLNERIVGYITGYIKEQSSLFSLKKIGEISGFMVKKEFREKGIGKLLFSEINNFFRNNDIRVFSLSTSIHNSIGIKFYKDNGMEELSIVFAGKIVK
jgi:ribosomal protein S18 acetylase RimI-like enzyme